MSEQEIADYFRKKEEMLRKSGFVNRPLPPPKDTDEDFPKRDESGNLPVGMQSRRTENFFLIFQKVDVRSIESLIQRWFISKLSERSVVKLIEKLFVKEGRCKWCGEKLPVQGDEIVGNDENRPGRPQLYCKGCDVLARNERRSIKKGVESSRDFALRKYLGMKQPIRQT